MKYLKFISLILCSLTTYGCFSNTNSSYNTLLISGQIINQKDGIITIYYQRENNLSVRDTAQIIDGRFHFKGSIIQPTMVSLRGMVKSQGDEDVNAVTFFVEPNQTLSILIKKDTFKEAKIEGSKTQKEFEIYNKATANLDFEPLLKYNYNYIENHKNSYVSIFMMNIFKQFWSVDSCINLYNSLNVEIKKSSVGKQVIKELQGINNTKTGNVPFNFKSLTLKGEQIELTDFKGKVVLLDFWASWCLPCRKGNPALINLYEKYHNKGLEIIGISSDEKVLAWKNAVEKDKISIWHQISSNIYDGKKIIDKENIGSKYGIQVLPTQILIGRDGLIFNRMINEININVLEKYLKKALEQP